MNRFVLVIAMLAISTPAVAGSANGVWKTESNDAGEYLEVTMGPCKSNAKLTCGVISNAFSKNSPEPGYSNIGKLIVKDMKPQGDNAYKGGTVWDPGKDKVYTSKMSVNGDDLEVKGCILFVCAGENWKRVK